MTPQKPDPKRRGGLPYAIQLRLSTAQYRHLIAVAEALDVSMAEAVRTLIEDAIDRRDKLTDEAGEGSISYRSILQLGDDSAFLAALDGLPTDAYDLGDERASG